MRGENNRVRAILVRDWSPMKRVRTKWVKVCREIYLDHGTNRGDNLFLMILGTGNKKVRRGLGGGGGGSGICYFKRGLGWKKFLQDELTLSTRGYRISPSSVKGTRTRTEAETESTVTWCEDPMGRMKTLKEQEMMNATTKQYIWTIKVGTDILVHIGMYTTPKELQEKKENKNLSE